MAITVSEIRVHKSEKFILMNFSLLLAREKMEAQDFPDSWVGKNTAANAGDTGSVPGLGRFHMPQSN